MHDYLVIKEDGRVHCLVCGKSHEFITPQGVDILEMRAYLKLFRRLHEGCKNKNKTGVTNEDSSPAMHGGR
jgi:transcription elongation factor Elf1